MSRLWRQSVMERVPDAGRRSAVGSSYVGDRQHGDMGSSSSTEQHNDEEATPDNFTTSVDFWSSELWNSTTAVPSTPTNLNDTKSCLEWEAAQHSLFQTANLFFAAAFLVPRSFKQSLLMLRAFLCVGFLLSALWAGIHVCAPDAFAWNVVLVVLNVMHTMLLTVKFLPPRLSLELAELYLKVFKPLRVSKKHFKELTREGQLMHLEPGETYAVQDVTSADERLSVLLRGNLRVTCDGIHLHYILPHQFIDSPEWEANHENSDDVFQVTITAEQECVYMCWQRMKLERVLRHRPLLKVVLSNIIGKDITHKLYSLNEHLNATQIMETSTGRTSCTMSRSLSMDAVHTGTRGQVRSLAWRAQQQRRTSTTYSDRSNSPQQHQCWVPVVANHFPVSSPFAAAITNTVSTPAAAVAAAATAPAPAAAAAPLPQIMTPPLQVPLIPVIAPPQNQVKTKSREVKFETHV